MTMCHAARPLSVHEIPHTDDRGDAAPLSPVQDQLRTLLDMPLALIPERNRPARARMRAWRGRNLRFAELRLPAHATAGGGRLAGAASRVLVSLHRAGEVRVTQGEHESVIPPGCLFVVDPSRPFGIRTGEIHTQSVYLPRAALVALLPDFEHLTALPVPCERGAGAVLRATLAEMFTHADSLDDDAADGLADALPHLLAPALAALAVRREASPSRLRRLHLQQIRRYVLEHLGDPALDGARIAHGVRLSARHVYELFAGQPEPLMKWVWSLRLQRVQQDLSDRRLAHRTIGDLAYAWGFSDVSHFSRAFKLRFGVTPRAHRAAALEAPSA